MIGWLTRWLAIVSFNSFTNIGSFPKTESPCSFIGWIFCQNCYSICYSIIRNDIFGPKLIYFHSKLIFLTKKDPLRFCLYSPKPIRRTRISINIQESVLNVAGEKFEASGGKKVGNRHVAIFRACIWFTWLHWDTLNIIRVKSYLRMENFRSKFGWK